MNTDFLCTETILIQFQFNSYITWEYYSILRSVICNIPKAQSSTQPTAGEDDFIKPQTWPPSLQRSTLMLPRTCSQHHCCETSKDPSEISPVCMGCKFKLVWVLKQQFQRDLHRNFNVRAHKIKYHLYLQQTHSRNVFLIQDTI